MLDQAYAAWRAGDTPVGGGQPDVSGQGADHPAQYGSAPGADVNDPLRLVPDGWVDYDNPGTQVTHFPGTANNHLSVGGLANATAYDYTVTYADDTTAAGEETTDGAGNLVLGGVQANFNAEEVKTINVYPDGGTGVGDTVAFADLTDRVLVTPEVAAFVDAYGLTWTVSRSAAGRKLAVVPQPILLLGTDDYLEVADHADLDFAADESFTVVSLWRTYGTPGATEFFLHKRAGGDEGYLLRFNGAARDVKAFIEATNTTSTADDTVAVSVAGQLFSAALVRDVANDKLHAALDGTLSAGTTDATTATLETTYPVHIGSDHVPDGFINGEFIGAAIFRSALTGAQIITAGNELQGIIVPTDVLKSTMALRTGLNL